MKPTAEQMARVALLLWCAGQLRCLHSGYEKAIDAIEADGVSIRAPHTLPSIAVGILRWMGVLE